MTKFRNLVLAGTFAAGTAFAATAGQAADIVDTAASVDTFSTLVAAVQAAGMVDQLKGEGPFTVLAPTNEAFAALPPGTLDELLLPENRRALADILKLHVIGGVTITSDDVNGRIGQAMTLAYQEIEFDGISDGVVFFEGARAIETDIMADNGVIHVIDAVILP